eukprot:GHVS01089085.1.p1 GENE.GHVS01089085.1~~GHVS01089085.1.p1  ORF type:complete len:198 (+),score=70.61 GHVS01089085.1:544-1137(+)
MYVHHQIWSPHTTLPSSSSRLCRVISFCCICCRCCSSGYSICSSNCPPPCSSLYSWHTTTSTDHLIPSDNLLVGNMHCWWQMAVVVSYSCNCCDPTCCCSITVVIAVAVVIAVVIAAAAVQIAAAVVIAAVSVVVIAVVVGVVVAGVDVVPVPVVVAVVVPVVVDVVVVLTVAVGSSVCLLGSAAVPAVLCPNNHYQ